VSRVLHTIAEFANIEFRFGYSYFYSIFIEPIFWSSDFEPDMPAGVGDISVPRHAVESRDAGRIELLRRRSAIAVMEVGRRADDRRRSITSAPLADQRSLCDDRQSGTNGIAYSASFATGDRLRAEVYIDVGDVARNKGHR
jgi:hypothetical protein